MDLFTKHPQWEDVKKICIKLKENGFTAWLAGGCVRDGLLGRVPKDFDIATNARPKKIESFFNKTVDVGKAFGVIRVICNSGDIEVATFRKDGQYLDGRHPTTVEVSTPPEDAKRRDFTINALFYDPFNGEVYDYVGGMADLKAKLIRTVGMPDDRFMEDRLRIIRAVRFVSQLDFNLEKRTLDAVSKFGSTVTEISWERISDEMSKLFSGLRVDRGVKLMYETGLLDVLFPELIFDQQFEDFFGLIKNEESKELLGWCALFSRVPELNDREKMAKRLKFSNEKKDLIFDVLDLVSAVKVFETMSLAEKKRLAAEANIDVALKFLETHHELKKGVKEFISKNPTLPIRFLEAADVLAIGIKPGKRLGEILEEVYDLQLEEVIHNRGEALTWIKTHVKA